MKWKNLARHQPEFNKLVHVAYIPMGVGAPEREGWQSKGRLREFGMWSILAGGGVVIHWAHPSQHITQKLNYDHTREEYLRAKAIVEEYEKSPATRHVHKTLSKVERIRKRLLWLKINT